MHSFTEISKKWNKIKIIRARISESLRIIVQEKSEDTMAQEHVRS